jgi:hypothetical protein
VGAASSSIPASTRPAPVRSFHLAVFTVRWIIARSTIRQRRTVSHPGGRRISQCRLVSTRSQSWPAPGRHAMGRHPHPMVDLAPVALAGKSRVLRRWAAPRRRTRSPARVADSRRHHQGVQPGWRSRNRRVARVPSQRGIGRRVRGRPRARVAARAENRTPAASPAGPAPMIATS